MRFLSKKNFNFIYAVTNGEAGSDKIDHYRQSNVIPDLPFDRNIGFFSVNRKAVFHYKQVPHYGIQLICAALLRNPRLTVYCNDVSFLKNYMNPDIFEFLRSKKLLQTFDLK